MPHSIVMPALSAGMEEATIARWLKGVGDTVVVGEVSAEIETDKATMEMAAEQAGTIPVPIVGALSAASSRAMVSRLLSTRRLPGCCSRERAPRA